jgi:hypothetical protein
LAQVALESSFITRFQMEFPSRAKDVSVETGLADESMTIEAFDAKQAAEIKQVLSLHKKLGGPSGYSKLVARLDNIMKLSMESVFDRCHEYVTQWWVKLPKWGDDAHLQQLNENNFMDSVIVRGLLDNFMARAGDVERFVAFAQEGCVVLGKIQVVHPTSPFLQACEKQRGDLATQMEDYTVQVTRLEEVYALLSSIQKGDLADVKSRVGRSNEYFTAAVKGKRIKKMMETDFMDRFVTQVLTVIKHHSNGFSFAVAALADGGGAAAGASGSGGGGGVSASAASSTGALAVVDAASADFAKVRPEDVLSGQIADPSKTLGTSGDSVAAVGDDDGFAVADSAGLSSDGLRTHLNAWRAEEISDFCRMSEMMWTTAAGAELEVSTFITLMDMLPPLVKEARPTVPPLPPPPPPPANSKS